jgi:hypothetical protein
LGGAPAPPGWWAGCFSEPAADDLLAPTSSLAQLLALQDPGESLQEVSACSARTDKGRPVTLKLYASGPGETTESILRRQSAALQTLNMGERVIRLDDSARTGNCHGLVFTGGLYWVPGAEVEPILRDNGYEQVKVARPGDVVVYRDEAGKILHTGLAWAVRGDEVLVESKWGKLGRFLHPAGVHGYTGAQHTFYRSPRPGHLLLGVEGGPSTISAPARASLRAF